MIKTVAVFGLAALSAMLFFGGTAQAAAERGPTRQSTAERRPHIVIHPRHGNLSPDAKRYCVGWLAVEHRPSGTVITPQRRCWWED